MTNQQMGVRGKTLWLAFRRVWAVARWQKGGRRANFVIQKRANGYRQMAHRTTVIPARQVAIQTKFGAQHTGRSGDGIFRVNLNDRGLLDGLSNPRRSVYLENPRKKIQDALHDALENAGKVRAI